MPPGGRGSQNDRVTQSRRHAWRRRSSWSSSTSQIGNEFSAHQQYVACAIYYDALTMPQMAAFFYRQALEERDHAMMMVQYLLDADADVAIPGVDGPNNDFSDIIAPVRLALEQEKRVSAQINELTGARPG